jgi:hypothetical protein
LSWETASCKTEGIVEEESPPSETEITEMPISSPIILAIPKGVLM